MSLFIIKFTCNKSKVRTPLIVWWFVFNQA